MIKLLIYNFLAIRLPLTCLALFSALQTFVLFYKYEILTIILLPLIILTIMDIKSRYSEFIRIKEIFSKSFKLKILERAKHSACQRNVCLAVSGYYGKEKECKEWFRSQGIKWYSVWVEIVSIKRYFSIRFWKTFYI